MNSLMPQSGLRPGAGTGSGLASLLRGAAHLRQDDAPRSPGLSPRRLGGIGAGPGLKPGIVYFVNGGTRFIIGNLWLFQTRIPNPLFWIMHVIHIQTRISNPIMLPGYPRIHHHTPLIAHTPLISQDPNGFFHWLPHAFHHTVSTGFLYESSPTFLQTWTHAVWACTCSHVKFCTSA